MSTLTKSSIKGGHTYYKHTGRYNEVSASSKHEMDNNASSALSQKRLVARGKKSASSSTLHSAWKELGWH